MGDLGGLGSFDMVYNDNDSISLAETLPTSDEAGTPAIFSSNPQSAVSSASSHSFPSGGITNDAMQNIHEVQTTISQCGCSLWAADLVKQFFTHSPADSSPSTGTTILSHHIETVISQNKQAIDKIDAILQCSFPHDGYMLVMMSMTLLKVIDCYAGATQTKSIPGLRIATGHESTSSTSSNESRNYGNTDNTGPERLYVLSASPSDTNTKGNNAYVSEFEEAKSAHRSIQMILGELHRPQRLVNHLSDLLKVEEAKSSRQEASRTGQCVTYSGLGIPKAVTAGANSIPTSLLSDVLLKQLELDLKGRLQSLSLEIRQALERE